MFVLTETKLHALYAAPIANAELPKYDLYEWVDIKYASTTTKVSINSTPKRSQAANEELCEMAACKLP